MQACVDLPDDMIASCRRDARAGVPNLFGTRDRFCGRQFFHGLGVGDGFRMIQVCYDCCALYFYYYIRSTSDDQALGPGGWGPLT